MKALANALILAAKIREESFDKESFDKESFDKDLRVNYKGEEFYYGISLKEACKEADKDNYELLYIMLSVAWNDFLEWAAIEVKNVHCD